ncbi:hypothetical protein M9458_010427, partial [Cirrhinus mrigala]
MTMDFADDDTSPTLDPVPSLTSPHSVECLFEPTTDGEPKTSATDEPSPIGATELRIAPRILPPAPPQSSVAPAPPRTSGSPPPPRLPEPWTPPWSSGSSVWPGLVGYPPRAPPPPALPPPDGPLESSPLPPPWLFPLS